MVLKGSGLSCNAKVELAVCKSRLFFGSLRAIIRDFIWPPITAIYALQFTVGVAMQIS